MRHQRLWRGRAAYGKCSEAAFGQCQDFARMVLGMDPFNTEEIWEHLHRHTFWGMGAASW